MERRRERGRCAAADVGGRAANGSAAAGSPTKRRVARTDTSAELDFDEFLEIMVRICNEKLPKPRDGPFEQSLNRWLGATPLGDAGLLATMTSAMQQSGMLEAQPPPVQTG